MRYVYIPEWKRKNEMLCYLANEALKSGESYGHYIARIDGRLPKVVIPEKFKKKNKNVL